MFRIRIIRKFLGLSDPDPIVRDGSDHIPSSNKNGSKTLISTVLWLFYDFLSVKNDVNAPLAKVLL